VRVDGLIAGIAVVEILLLPIQLRGSKQSPMRFTLKASVNRGGHPHLQPVSACYGLGRLIGYITLGNAPDASKLDFRDSHNYSPEYEIPLM
jgi:hypothetical protein